MQSFVRRMKQSRSISLKNITPEDAPGRNPELNHRGDYMYKINDQIIYGNSGVCKIMDITAPKNIGTDNDQLYYVLQPLDQRCVIYAPVNTKVFMRPVISVEEAERLIDTIPAIQAEAYYSNRINELTRHYQTVLQANNCADLIELVMSIKTKKKTAELQNRKLGQIDERFMKQTEELLYGEFSLALGIPKNNVSKYIASRVGAKKLG